MGELSKGSGISAIRGGDFELGASGVTAVASSDVVVEDITPLALMPLEDDLGLVLGTGSATFTRSTIKTFDDRNDGLVKTVAIDVAAFEQNGYLGEGASDNLLLRSEEFDNASWTKSTAVVSADAATAPDGTTTADGVQASSTSSQAKRIDQATASVAISTIVNHTVFVKKAAQDFAAVTIFDAATKGVRRFIDLRDGSILTNDDFNSPISPFVSTKVLINGWVRITVGLTTGLAGAVTARVQPAAVDGTRAYATATGVNQIFIWGAQLEELPFASSYIKTVASTVTRTADNLSIDAANIPAPTDDYTISMEVDAIGFDSSLSQVLFNVAGETSRRIAWNTTTGAIEATHGAVTSVSTSTFSAGDRVKISFAVDATNQTLFINGIQEDQDAKGTVTGTATAINIGHEAGINQAFSLMKLLRIDDTELTAAQVAAL